ncbi:MAG: response regulator [Deltaproteobacteria bacterium]|nr:response regulator [Deltaproteobacteria bacterium]
MKKILVADDSVTIQKVIALTFADEPVEVQSVGSGSDALDKMKEWRPDIVLADVIMPRVNGYELCRAVKEDESTRDIPVLLLAGTFEAFDEEEAKGAGADDFITKPFESMELIEKVNGLLEKGTPPPPEPHAHPEVPPPPESHAHPEVPPPPESHAYPEVPPDAIPEPPSPSFGDVQVKAPQVPVAEPTFEPIQGVAGMDAAMATAPPGGGATPEPDIWDILSEADEMKPVEVQEPAEVETDSPSIGPLEGSGVVDFGSFDVGLDRAEETRETGMTTAPDEIPPPIEDAVPPTGMPLDADGGSKIEQRERNFFGLETERTEPEFLDILGEAVEEITFDVEEPAPLDVQEPASLDVQEPTPFDVQEPISQDVREEETGFSVPEPMLDEIHETVEAAISQIDDVKLESIIREVVEKRVEKIAWEVVPELSEILIKEAIEKIKGGGA